MDDLAVFKIAAQFAVKGFPGIDGYALAGPPDGYCVLVGGTPDQRQQAGEELNAALRKGGLPEFQFVDQDDAYKIMMN